MAVTVAIVACGPQLEVAVHGPELRAASLVRLAGRSPRSRLLLAAVDLLLEDAELARSAATRVLVTRGPGSFTGIRTGLATAAGLRAALGVEVIAFDSLAVQAARCLASATVWAAQPGRRGEVYARRFEVAPGCVPVALGEIEVVAVTEAFARGPWVAADALELPGADRSVAVQSAAEALLELDRLGAPRQPAAPLYVEGPPIHTRGSGG